jgi:SAM-dependent methyltransferase
MTAADWDARYRGSELVWGAAPNRWVERETADLLPGRVLDIACGEGRNSIWLARRGWQVTAVDFSAEALGKARRLDDSGAVSWHHGDATALDEAAGYDLVLVVYLQLPEPDRSAALTAAWRAVAPGGTLLVVAHDSRNLTDGTGGPQDPACLYSAADVAALLDASEPRPLVELCTEVLRPVDGAHRPAIDALLRARRT